MAEINIKERSPEEKINYLMTQFALQKVNQKKDHDDIRTLDKAVFGLDDISRITTLEKNFHGIVVKGPGCPNWLINLEIDLKRNANQDLILQENISELKAIETITLDTLKVISKDYKTVIDILRELGNELKELVWLAEKENWTTKELCPVRMKVIETLKKLDGDPILKEYMTPFQKNQLTKEAVEKAFSYDRSGMTPKEMDEKDNQIRKKLMNEIYPKEPTPSLVDEFQKFYSNGFKSGRFFEKHHGEKCKKHNYLLEAQEIWQLLRIRCSLCGDTRDISEESRQLLINILNQGKKDIMFILYKYRCHDCDHHGDDSYCDSSCDYKWDVLDKIKKLLDLKH